MIVLLKGILLGTLLSLPLGPISILCIQRTVNFGIKIGLLTAMGSALADGVFGSIAIFGLLNLINLLQDKIFIFHLFGCLLLVYLGLKIALDKPQLQTEANLTAIPSKHSRVRALPTFFSAFILTLANPVTILTFTALFAGSGVIEKNQINQQACLLIIGIMLGSTLWELTLSVSVKKLLQINSMRHISKHLNFISGSLLILLAVLVFVKTMISGDSLTF